MTFRDVTVRYGKHTVVHDFAASLPAGGWMCLIGANGAGKSSILRTVAGLVAHTGDVVIGGTSLRSMSSRQRAALVAYVPQNPAMPAEMSAFEYVLLGRTPYVSYFGTETAHDRQIVAEVLETLDLTTFADRDLESLSGGEQQRLVIARALAQEAPILLLDEPTSALDIGHQQQALELVDRLRRERGLTVISAMHDLTLAGLYADRLVLLSGGRQVLSGRAEDVLRPDTLARYYGVTVSVHHEPDGTVVIVPRRTTSR
jgi:iron complex transport system ATP-binding protein